MRWKGILIMVIVLIMVILLIIYFFIPYNITELDFSSLNEPENPNFNLDGSYKAMQFYNNMRFPYAEISYRIEDNCTLSKKASMEEAFEILENATILNFYPVSSNEEIIVQCDSKEQVEGGMFIAGEGGPTNITVAGDLNIITSGKILLIREPNCPRPNVPLHELLHVLGFDHSENEDNIMYEITKCKQTLGEDIPGFINEIYSIPSYPDLTFEDAEGNMQGKYLNANFSVRNQGIISSPDTEILIYADDKIVKEVELESLRVGYGTKISLYNIWVNKISLDEIRFVINSDFEELSRENNEITLVLKK
jgi:hypothetical protein